MSHRSPISLSLHASYPLCISHLLTERAKHTPEALALLAPERTPLSYSHLHQHVHDVAQRLHAMGVCRGDRVAVVLPNGPEMAVAALAVAAGATCVPLNPAYRVQEFDFYLAALRVKVLLVQAGMDSPARAVALARDIRIIELVPRGEEVAGYFTLTGEERRHPTLCEFAHPDDVAVVLHTSGTTARPKLVPLTHANVCTRAHHKCVVHQLVESDRCLNVMPLCHGHGLINTLLTSLMAGASVVCTPGFEATKFFVWMTELRPTWYSASPTIHQALLAQAAQERPVIERCPLRFIRSGTAPLAPQLLADLERVFNAPVTETYGLTETSMITCNPLPSRERRTGSVGGAIGTEVAVMDEEGTLLPVGVTGEVVVRGTTVMQGYENDPMANRSAFTHGWFRSGDAGYLDADGYLFLTGRIKEIINRGGEKIAPQEVDDALLRHPAVAEAVTFAVPHARLGEDVATAVVLRQHASVTASALRQFVATRLAVFKVPSQVLIVDDIPKDPVSGKLQRHNLAARLGLTADDRAQHALPADASSPRSPLEETLTGLWAQVLGLDGIGIYDNFFQLGGDSILATQLMTRVREIMHVEISFRSFFETPTIEGMARHIETAGQVTPSLPAPPMQPVPRDGPLPLSYAQQRLWFLEQLEPSRAVYNQSLAWRFLGKLNVPAIEQSLEAMVLRHEILRTIFPAVDGQPVQVIVPDLALPLPIVDLQAVPATERETTIQRLAGEARQWPFDLAHGPLVRTALLRLASEDHVLLVTLHHIIFDGWSTEVFWRELVSLYTAIDAGQPLALPALPIQYADFAVWQRQWFQGEMLAAQLAYWKEQLDKNLPVLNLPTDRPHPSIQTFRGARHTRALPQCLSTALKALSQLEGVTLFMTLAAAFQALLFRYTGQTEIVVGTPIAGRTRSEIEGLVGFFVNTLVLRTDLSGNPCFRALLRQVREVTLGAYDHQELPFEKLVEILQPVRDLSRNPLVQVLIALQPSPPSPKELPGLTIHSVAIDAGTAKFELALSLQDTAQGLLGTLEYNTDLFDQATIMRMMGHFHVLLEGIIADPEQHLANLPLLTAVERQQLLGAWNITAKASAQESCLHQLFEVQVKRTPDAVALICNAQQMTYGALNQRANQLAHHLQTWGVGPEVCVGLCVERSLEMVVGLMGILKAGGAYVPLDPDYPAERIAAMMADAQVTMLVTQQQYVATLSALGVQIVCLDTDWDWIAHCCAANPASGVTPENLAYVMSTSGSTGAPKGVMVEHSQVLAFLYGFEHITPGGEQCIGTAVCPFGFDVSVWECFSVLCFGGTLHILLPDVTAPELFANYLIAHRITSTYIPPVLLSDVANHLEQQHTQIALRRLLVGVEPIPQDTLQRLSNLSEQMHIINGYGPTETTVCATLFPFRTATEPGRRTPIGTTINGYEVYIVDTHLQPVPIGIPGELLIGGTGLARGYSNRPELTAESFMPHPFSTIPGARLYKTGDLVRYLPDGNLEFLGRRDQQIKIRGYRIELEEVAVALRQHPAVREAVILAREDMPHGDRHLVAYVVPRQEPAPTPDVLRLFLIQKLPTYMVPSAFVVLEALPRTPHGKLDRQALPLPDTTLARRGATFVAPRTPVERALACIWADVLGLERVGVHDNFFELGGDSVRSIQSVARANQAGFRLTPKHLFQHQTVAELAAVAGPLLPTQTSASLVTSSVSCTPTQRGLFESELPDGGRENIEAIYPLSPLQQGILFHSLYAVESGVYCAQWSCILSGNLQASAFQQVWQQVVDRHPVLRTAFNWQLRDEPFQIVYKHVELPWRQHDWRSVSAVIQERQLETLRGKDRTQGFELSKAPLMRLTLVRLAEDTYQFVWSVHHLLLDGWSVPLLLREVFQMYDACCTGREMHRAVRRPYGDYIAWLQQQDVSQAEAFWRQTLKGFTAPTIVDCGGNHNHSSGKEEAYAEQQMRLSVAETAALQALAQQHRLSVNTLAQGVWAVLLSRYSGQEDVVFGATVAGRPTDLVGFESMIGLFINTLPVRVRVSPATWLLSWLQELQSQQVEARQYEYSPLVQVQGWSDVPRGLPLFESLLVFENYPTRTALQARRDNLEIHRVRFMSSTHYPLTVVVLPDHEMGWRIKYQCDRFDTATITRMLGHLLTLLESIIANPAQRLADLPMLTTAERSQLLVEWNNTSTAHPQDTCMHQWFEDQVARTPDAVAVVFEEQTLTYQQLNLRANKLAYHLQTLGVGPEVRVGIYVERSVEMIVGLLGVLKAGGAYVPLDPTYPQERLTFTLQDAQVPVLLTQQRLLTEFIEPRTQVVCLDTDWQRSAQESETNPVTKVMPNNLVYIMYTSGSTGRPKGVAVEHQQLCNYLYGVLQCLELPSPTSFATVSTLATDLGNTMVFAALCTGGCLHVLAPERVANPYSMADYCTRHAIDCLKIVPSHLAALHSASHPEDIFPRRLLILGGEASRSEWVENLQKLAPACAILNHYGPTEATVGVLTYRVEASKRAPITLTLPLGRPLANVQIYLLDQHLQPVPIGVQGELYIGGANLARGYLKQPALTAERFIPHPFSDAPGARLYRTGDLARYLPDGNIEFLGRSDYQVKIRGYRVELAEVEALLHQHPAIRQAVVCAQEDMQGNKRIVAYGVLSQETALSLHTLRSFLQTKLPDYMIPTAFIVLDTLPLTANGKIDRQALPASGQTQSSLGEAFVAHRTPTEELLAGILACVLGLESVSMHDNFFALGGHSLLAMQVVSRLRQVFQVDVPLPVLFDAPTVASLARYVEEACRAGQRTPAPPLHAIPRQGAVPLTMTQEHLWDLDRLLPGAPFSNMPYAARLTGPLNVTALEQSFNEIIKRHETLRTTFTTIAEQPVQVIAPTLYLPLLMEDLCAWPKAEREVQAQRLIRTEVLDAFDLENGPLLHVRLLRLGVQEHILLLTMHHIISDGWSWGVLLHELAVLYDAFSQSHPSPLPALPIQYADYAHWQQQWLHSETGQAQLAYWMQQLHTPLPLLKLPTDRPRTAELSLRTARQSFQLPKELTMAITRLSRQEGTTVFMTLLAAFKLLLYSYTSQEDIRVGTLVANRQHQDTDGLIGLFANLTILRTNLGENPSLRQVLQRVRMTTLDTYAHQDLPFEYLARALVHARQCDRQALFQVMFAMQNARQHTLTLPALTIQALETQPIEASACDLAMSVRESAQGLDGACIYNTALFDATTMSRMLEDYRQTLERLIVQPELRLSSLRIQQSG